MSSHRDIVDIDGFKAPGNPPGTSPKRAFLSIWYRCCHVYGRLYRDAACTAYTGRCPRCGAHARVQIDPDGSASRMFEAR